MPPPFKSSVGKRSLVVGPRKTSITLEDAFWHALKEIAASEGLTPGQLVARIDTDREHANLSSVLRLYILDYYRQRADEAAADAIGERP